MTVTARRKEAWQGPFNDAVDAVRTNQTEVGIWGSGDCLTGLVSPVVEAMTGEDPFSRFRGRYKTPRGALGIMRRSGFANLADLVASEFPEVHSSAARMGDIAAVPTDDDFAYSLGIVNGDRVIVLRPDGMGSVPMTGAVRIFKVE